MVLNRTVTKVVLKPQDYGVSQRFFEMDFEKYISLLPFYVIV